MEQNVIHIDTLQPAFASELPNQMMISITTSDQIPVSNLVNLSTNGMISITEKPPKKHKKIKKSKEKAVDIVIDTSMPASMVSVPQPFPFMVPIFDQSNQISIPTNPMPIAANNSISIEMPTTIYQAMPFPQSVSIPIPKSMP